MRLLMTADAVGGVWTQTIDCAGGLAALGVVTTVAVLGPAPDSAQVAASRQVAGLRLVWTGLPLDWTAAAPEAMVRAARAIAELAVGEGADTVQLHTPALATARFAMPVVAACHSCVATWWDAVRYGPLPADLAWRAALVGRGLRAADAVIAPTRAFAEATARRYGLAALPIIVRNGRAPMSAAPRADAPARFLLTAGRLWDAGKDLATLDRAAALLRVPVVALGQLAGPDGACVVPDHLVAPGACAAAEVAGWMRAATLFVSMARYEPFGLAVLEAAQAGLPLLLSDIPTFRELWDGAAVFVPPGDAEALAAAAEDILADDARRTALGRAAAVRAGHYGVSGMAEATLAVHRSLRRSAAA